MASNIRPRAPLPLKGFMKAVGKAPTKSVLSPHFSTHHAMPSNNTQKHSENGHEIRNDFHGRGETFLGTFDESIIDIDFLDEARNDETHDD